MIRAVAIDTPPECVHPLWIVLWGALAAFVVVGSLTFRGSDGELLTGKGTAVAAAAIGVVGAVLIAMNSSFNC